MNAASFAGRLDLCLTTLGICHIEWPAEDPSRIVHEQVVRALPGLEVRPLRSRP